MVETEHVSRWEALSDRDLESFSGHGDVYRWLRKNYREVSDRKKRERPSWGTITAKIAANGIKGRNGLFPTKNSVVKVWRRVCEDLKNEANEAEEARKKEEEERLDREHYNKFGVPRNGVVTREYTRPRVAGGPGTGLVVQEKTRTRSGPRIKEDGTPETDRERIQRKQKIGAGRLPMERD